ncbi:MAG: hypothetical protein A2Z76_02925 [Chloroflexi bacterium RBG_13_56_8b]|nr:MAG: hypothetical protein A2Z76_02925 [Chloroflexi bacterium RBG_13_56_8b]
MTKHPFNEGTKLAQIFTILSDGEWHCGKHELPGTQPAKAIQIIRQHGFQIENKTQDCPVCKDKTVHRRLVSVEPLAPSFVRQQFPAKLRKRVLDHYNNTEAITLRQMYPNQLEVDHRFPQVRWSQDETFAPDMPEEQIRRKFQLLTREHNLWKSRYCERCKQTRERGTFIGINYFYEGGEMWDKNIADDDEQGCLGCFWYDPETWRNSLNLDLKRK